MKMQSNSPWSPNGRPVLYVSFQNHIQFLQLLEIMIGVTNTLTMLVMALMLGQPMAHPGHSLDQEIAERSTYLKHTKKDLSHCAAKMKARGIEERALQRRAAAIQGLRKAKKGMSRYQTGACGYHALTT